ncbi:MAG: chemotaxis protein CheB [Lysobacterales bacterium]
MRVAIAHHDRLVRQALRRALSRTEFEIAWQVDDFEPLERRSSEEPPELLLAELDLLGPRAERLPALLANGCAIIVLASASAVGAGFEALGLGALALLAPPTLDENGELHGAARFVDRLQRFASLARANQTNTAVTATATATQIPDGLPPLIALGASTGGPLALATILGSLSVECPAAVLVVQHIESDFVGGFAQWLGTRCALPVSVAKRGTTPRAGHVYVAASTHHLVLLPSHQFGGLMPQPGDVHVPSVDALFRSLAQNAPPGIAALLTGMGADGVEGLLVLRQSGWHTLAQDQASSVVYGMPRAAAARGAVVRTLPLERIGAELMTALSMSATARGRKK